MHAVAPSPSTATSSPPAAPDVSSPVTSRLSSATPSWPSTVSLPRHHEQALHAAVIVPPASTPKFVSVSPATFAYCHKHQSLPGAGVTHPCRPHAALVVLVIWRSRAHAYNSKN